MADRFAGYGARESMGNCFATLEITVSKSSGKRIITSVAGRFADYDTQVSMGTFFAPLNAPLKISGCRRAWRAHHEHQWPIPLKVLTHGHQGETALQHLLEITVARGNGERIMSISGRPLCRLQHPGVHGKFLCNIENHGVEEQRKAHHEHQWPTALQVTSPGINGKLLCNIDNHGVERKWKAHHEHQWPTALQITTPRCQWEIDLQH